MNKLQGNQGYPVVFWQEIQGNKYSKSLHPAMLSSNGFRTTQKAALIGNPKNNTEFVTVIYDITYVINWLERKLIKAFETKDLETIQDLIKVAYTNVTKAQASQLPFSENESNRIEHEQV